MLFSIGKVQLTKAVLEDERIDVSDLVDAFSRYIRGDWGDLDSETGLANDLALTSGGKIVAKYRLFNGRALVMTTWAGITLVEVPEDRETDWTARRA